MAHLEKIAQILAEITAENRQAFLVKVSAGEVKRAPETKEERYRRAFAFQNIRGEAAEQERADTARAIGVQPPGPSAFEKFKRDQVNPSHIGDYAAGIGTPYLLRWLYQNKFKNSYADAASVAGRYNASIPHGVGKTPQELLVNMKETAKALPQFNKALLSMQERAQKFITRNPIIAGGRAATDIGQLGPKQWDWIANKVFSKAEKTILNEATATLNASQRATENPPGLFAKLFRNNKMNPPSTKVGPNISPMKFSRNVTAANQLVRQANPKTVAAVTPKPLRAAWRKSWPGLAGAAATYAANATGVRDWFTQNVASRALPWVDSAQDVADRKDRMDIRNAIAGAIKPPEHQPKPRTKVQKDIQESLRP